MAIDLSKYDILIPQGDSMMREFFRQTFYQDTFCERHINFTDCKHPLSSPGDVSVFINFFNQHHQSTMEFAVASNKTIAFITGSGIWDLAYGWLSADMTKHLDAISEYITTIRTQYPSLDIYWKSPSPMHLHRRGRPPFSMTSYITAKNLYVGQKKLMKELNVPFLDLYNAYFLSAAWTAPGDTIHFAKSTLSTFLVSYFWPGLIERYLLQRIIGRYSTSL